jgi:hypothetical protein
VTSAEGVQELYPTERNAVISIRHELMQKHSFHKVSTESQENAVKRAFEAEAKDRLGQIGLRGDVVWNPEVYEMPDGTYPLVWEPDLVIYERINGTGSIDYERIQNEVRAGEADGKVGVIREDGTWREDAVKKNL